MSQNPNFAAPNANYFNVGNNDPNTSVDYGIGVSSVFETEKLFISAPLKLNVLIGKPVFLIDFWETHANIWFNMENNYSMQDLVYMYIIGCDITGKVGPRWTEQAIIDPRPAAPLPPLDPPYRSAVEEVAEHRFNKTALMPLNNPDARNVRDRQAFEQEVREDVPHVARTLFYYRKTVIINMDRQTRSAAFRLMTHS